MSLQFFHLTFLIVCTLIIFVLIRKLILRMMCYSVNDTGVLRKKYSEFQTSDLPITSSDVDLQETNVGAGRLN